MQLHELTQEEEMLVRQTDTIDPDVWVQIGFQLYRAVDIFGDPNRWVQLQGACKGDEKDTKK